MSSPQKFWLLFGGLWLAVGGIFAVVGGIVLWKESEREARLAQDAESATAVVLAKTRRGGSRSDSSFRIEYRFPGPGGASIEGATEVDEGSWQSLAEGQSFEVRYLRDAPQVHRVPGERRGERVIGPVFAAVGALFAVAGALILWRALAQRAMAEQLRGGGMRVDAEVIDVGPMNFRLNRQPMWRIRYRYRDHLGTTHEASTPPLAQEEARAWQPGERGAVRFDTARPRRHVWLGKA